MKEHKDPMPVALYARVSSDRQDVDLSVAAQLRALRDYANKSGYFVAREYVDEAESGRVANRPEFRKMIDEAQGADAPFKEILVWKFSRFTRKREHAVAFKSMLRRKGVRVVSITEHADDSPTGKLMEAIIESVDEFYSENLAQEVMRGLREAASRGFWITPNTPYGYRKVHVQDGAKKRPKLEIEPGSAPVRTAHVQNGRVGKEHPRHRQDLQRRGNREPGREAMVEDGRPQHAEQRDLHGDARLGRHGEGQGPSGQGGRRLSGDRIEVPVQACLGASAVQGTVEGAPPASGKLLHAQWPRQVQELSEGAQRTRRQERKVLLLRLPVDHEAWQGGLQDSQVERPTFREACRRPDSVQHPDRGQH